MRWPEWEKKGLYIFFLPKYCSEMNPIELEWQQLKTHELVGQMFEDELDKRLCGHGWSRGQRSRGEIHHRAF
jgi:transposase